MSKLNRLFDLASKALGNNNTNGTSASSPAGGTDWRGMVRSAADSLTGDSRTQTGSGRAPASAPAAASPGLVPPSSAAPRATGPGLQPPAAGSASTADRAAIARYDYLMQTADPHQVEQIHRDAFARLTPQQRAQIEQRMQTEFAPNERPRSSAAPDLARAAARSEALNPGRMRGLLARAGRGGAIAGVGGAAVGVLGAVAGGAILSTVAAPLLEQAAGWGVDFETLAGGLDVEAIAGDALGGASEALGGVGEQVSGFGEQLGGFELPGLGDFFGR